MAILGSYCNKEVNNYYFDKFKRFYKIIIISHNQEYIIHIKKQIYKDIEIILCNFLRMNHRKYLECMRMQILHFKLKNLKKL
jgi:hypothetical protein